MNNVCKTRALAETTEIIPLVIGFVAANMVFLLSKEKISFITKLIVSLGSSGIG